MNPGFEGSESDKEIFRRLFCTVDRLELINAAFVLANQVAISNSRPMFAKATPEREVGVEL